MNYRLGNRVSQILLCCIGILYCTFMALDFFGGPVLVSSIVKFVSILLCFAFTIVRTICYQATMDRLLLNVAFLFTVIADIFLLFTVQFTYGVAAFCVVQLIYFYRMFSVFRHTLRMENRVHKKRSERGVVHFLLQLILRTVISIGLLILLGKYNVEIDVLLMITVFYFVNFVGNLIFLFLLIPKRHHIVGQIRYGLFFLGMVLFFLCDIQVGLYNISDYLGSVSGVLAVLVNLAGIGMWAFYLPGQVAIAMSDVKSGKSGRGSFI